LPSPSPYWSAGWSRLEPDARSPSPTTVLPLMEFTALQGVDMRSAAGVHWVPRARYAVVVSDASAGIHRSPSAACLRLRLHPLVSFAPLQSPPSRVRRRCLHRQRLPWGLRSLFATSPTGVRAPSVPALGAFPSAAFLTPSTAFSAIRLVGLFHPTATSRVCSSGVFPRKQPRRFSPSLLMPSCRWPPAR
jgi:hypothetical protein